MYPLFRDVAGPYQRTLWLKYVPYTHIIAFIIKSNWKLSQNLHTWTPKYVHFQCQPRQKLWPQSLLPGYWIQPRPQTRLSKLLKRPRPIYLRHLWGCNPYYRRISHYRTERPRWFSGHSQFPERTEQYCDHSTQTRPCLESRGLLREIYKKCTFKSASSPRYTHQDVALPFNNLQVVSDCNI